MKLCIFFSVLLVIGCQRQQVNTANPSSNEIKVPPAVINQDSILKDATLQILTALKAKDYQTLSAYIHPSYGIRFSPYAHVDTLKDIHFTKDKFLDEAMHPNIFLWGNFDGSGEPIEMTLPNYLQRFAYDHDFLNAEKLSVNKMLGKGNTQNNLQEAYPGSAFTESYFSGFDQQAEGMDWSALKLVFKRKGDHWFLVGIIHDQWTI